MDDIQIAVLAGKNKGRHKEQEKEDKNKTGRCYKTKFLDGDKKLFIKLKNGKRVLENTIEPIYEVTSKPPVIIGCSEELEFILKGYDVELEEQTGESLGDNVVQLANYVKNNTDSNEFLLMTGDLPSLSPTDLEFFLKNAYSETKDVVMGLVDVEEMDRLYQQIRSRETKNPKKFGIRFIDNKGTYHSKNPKLTFGSVFLIRNPDKAEVFKYQIDEMYKKKRLFMNPDNYSEIADLLKDDNIELAKYPTSKLSLAKFALKYSTPMRKLLLGNYITGAKSKYSMNITEAEQLLEDKVFNNRLSLGIIRAPANFGFDIDDANDVEIANRMYKLK